MTPDELYWLKRNIKNWFGDHLVLVDLGLFIALCFACIIPMIANNHIPQACGGLSDPCYELNGLFDWGYAFKWWAIGVGVSIVPTILFYIAKVTNYFVRSGRHAAGLTREARRERERRREQHEADQALALVRAEERIRELERETGVPPLDKDLLRVIG